jgi:DNA polymerase V
MRAGTGWVHTDSGAIRSGGKTPLAVSRVRAGFPSPAEDYIEDQLDFNELLVRHPAATFCIRVSGDSMTGAGIHSGDILVVDRALEPAQNSIVVAEVDGNLTVKRIQFGYDSVSLVAENPAYQPIVIKQESLMVWGVVTYVLHRPK